jgi:hypothetical protein
LFVGLALNAGATTGITNPLPMRTVAKGAFSGITSARQVIIKDKAAWNKLWAQHSLNQAAASSAPELDLAKEMVIVVTLGRRNTGGYTIEIVKVEADDKRLRIAVQRKAPPPGAMVIQALTAPFHMAAIPRSDLKAEFVEVKEGGK